MAVGGFSERLAFLLELDPSNAVAGMRRVGDAADRELGKTDDKLNRIGGQMQAVGAGAVAFAGVAARALMGFASAFEEAEAESRKLDQAMATNASFAEEGRESFDDLAASLQDLTGADGDAITGMLGFLGTLGQTADEAQRAAPLIVDLATRFGLELEPAARLVNNALEGNASRLERLIGPIGESENALDALSRTVGGFAEREAQTFSGQLEILKQNLGDVAEGIGGGVVGAFNDLIGPVKGAADRFSELDASTQNSIGKFAAYATAATGTVGAISFLAGSLIKLRTRFTDLDVETGTRSLNRFGQAAAFVGGAAAIGSIVVGLTEMREQLTDVRLDVNQFAANTANEMEGFAERFGMAFQSNNEFSREFTDQLLTNIPASERFADALDNAGHSSAWLREQITQARAELVQATVDQENQSTAIAAGAEATGDLTDETAVNTAALEENRRALEERTEAALSARGEELSLAEAMIATANELDSYNEVMASGEATDRERQQASIDLEQQFYAEAEAAGRSAFAQAVAAGNAAGAQSASVQAQIDALNRLLNNIGPSSPLRSGILGHIAALQAVPRDIETRIRTVNQIVNAGTITTRGFGPSGVKAAGGLVETGVTQVNERGVELYTDPTGAKFLLGGEGGTVTPNHALSAVGGGAATIVLQFSGDINVSTAWRPDDPRTAALLLDGMEALVQREGHRRVRQIAGLT